jgi:4-hydroxybenzoate-CoA ligase
MTGQNHNAALYFVDRHRKGVKGSKLAFIETGNNGRRLSYRDLADQSDQMAGLFARNGIRREDRALMLVHDTLEFPVIFWGALKAGIIPVPLNTMLTDETYSAIIADCRPTALFVSAPMLDEIGPLLATSPNIRAVFVIGEHQTDHLNFQNELEQSTPASPIHTAADECAFWLYSSGSTGTPKGVRHVHSSLQATSDTYGQQVLGITVQDTIYSAAKMFFAYGLGNAMSFPMAVGATTILLAARPTPDAISSILTYNKPTIFCGVPTLYAAMLAALGTEKPDWASSLRLSISAGEALPADIGNRWRSLVGSDILDGVGSTELLHIFLSNAPEDLDYGTSGVAVPGYDLRLVDDAGNDVKTGDIGELLVNAPSAADGYWNQRTKSRATFAGNWTHTGDKYFQRPDGRYIYCGRTDDMFKVSGIWVSPFEVEQALIAHTAVLEAAVVSARDTSDLEKPKAFVVLKDTDPSDQLASELQDHVKAEVGNWKYPRWIEFVDDLPKTATGKIQRFKLRN